ncbi:hypothetical protein [Aeromonas hydrophila]|uniref:hypothetical protein n=1 Tax=Aeromonas hydrophila TaxID=644 RepID=UPI00191D14C8|nr:hypothetical protein [Aeromonas hydrophila]MBL0560960.1 hypothetical protein [Aeromonas hydrophila]
MKKIILLFLLVNTTPIYAADVFSEAHKLGTFFGAMKFCESTYRDKEDQYRWARLQVAKAVSDMPSKNKTAALFASSNAERKGTYLGNRLDQRECEGLLKLREWKRFSKK